jgi:general secretion pathway protein M
VLTLTAAGGDELRAWLSEVRAGARARPVELNLTRSEEGVSGTVVLALPAANAP